MLGKFFENNGKGIYAITRIVVGLLFLAHGAMKFGLFKGEFAMPSGLFLAAGIIEVVAGLALAFGIFSRLVAFISGIEMLVAYVYAHFPKGWNPLGNGGELAIMYLMFFLIVMVNGNGIASLEKVFSKKEMF